MPISSRSQHSSAFTLIELLIAIGLGSAVIFVAISGFRLAAQFVTVANRMSLENGMLRAGYIEAHQQLDFWTGLDDPDNTSKQALRPTVTGWGWPGGPENVTVGLPFSRFNQVDALKPVGLPRLTSDASQPGDIRPRSGAALNDTSWENDKGFDPSYAWAAHDPRTWYRGNMGERRRGNAQGRNYPVPQNAAQNHFIPTTWFGRYALFSNIESSPTLCTMKMTPEIPTETTVAMPPYDLAYGPVTVPHRWHANQIRSLMYGIGYYGMCDYLPRNSIYSFYQNYITDKTSDGGISRPCYDPAAGFINVDGGQITARGIYRGTYATSFAVTNPYRPATPGIPAANGWVLFNEHYMHYDTDYTSISNFAIDTANNNVKSSLQYFTRVSTYPFPLMAQRPQHWPEVTVAVGHYVKSARLVNVARVSWTSPLTGDIVDLSFCGIGTTLRGARQQRKPVSGWAVWDDVPGQANGQTLDTP